MSAREIVVIGAGANGMAAAARLAAAGRKVRIFERSPIVGGLAAGYEFHPGYRGAGILEDTTTVRLDLLRGVVGDDELREATTAPTIHALSRRGPALAIHGDPRRTASGLEEFNADDARAYLAFTAFLERLRPLVRSFVEQPPIDLIRPEGHSPIDLLRRGLDLRRRGKREFLEFLRLPPMSVADWLGEWFANDRLKAALALPAVAGNWMGPRSPQSNANLILGRAAAGPGVAGGAPALLRALESACRRHGVEITTGAPVARILIGNGQARGVALEDGSEIECDTVVSSCDLRQTFGKLVSPTDLSWNFLHNVDNFRTRGTTAVMHLAFDDAPTFRGAGDDPVEFARTGDHLDEIEQAFDAVKYGTFSERPILEVHVPTVAQPDHAPANHAVWTVKIHFAPHDLREGWSDDTRDRLSNATFNALEEIAPGVRDRALAADLLTPPEIERRYGTTGGHIFHGEHALDQYLVRPIPGALSYRTPIASLYLCGASSHPGGTLSCAPGILAAASLLEG